MSWARVPAALRIAVVLSLVTFAVLAAPVFSDHMGLWVQLAVAAGAARYATSVLFAIGALDLSRQHAGVARRGAQIALVAAVLELALELLWRVMSTRASLPAAVGWLLSYGLSAATLGRVVGFAIVARRRFPRLAIAGIVAGVATRLAFFAIGALEIRVLLTGFHAALMLVLVLAASTEHDVALPELAERGFRHAARALWLRVVAVGLVPLLTMLTAGSRATAGILATATAAAALTSVVSLTYLGIGAIGAAHARLAELRAGSLYASGVSALMCAGLTLVQTAAIYDDALSDRSAAWPILTPLIAIASLGYLVRAVHGFATRRELHDLRMRSSGSGPFACVLLVVSFVITAWLRSGASSEGMMVFLMVASLVCAL
jgi:hypothetical protein